MDELKITVSEDPNAHKPRKQYKVVTVAGLFKRGRQWEAGELIELDDETAARFIALGDVEEVADV